MGRTLFVTKLLVCRVVFRSLQEVHLDKHVKLIDSPGIVMATGSGDPASLVLRNCVKVSVQVWGEREVGRGRGAVRRDAKNYQLLSGVIVHRLCVCV